MTKIINFAQPADDPKVVLLAAADSELSDVVIVGLDADGELFVASSFRSHRDAHYLLCQGADELRSAGRSIRSLR